MPDQTTDRDTTWALTGDGKSWTLTTNATIAALEDDVGIVDAAVGSQIHVLGTAIGGLLGVQMGSSSSSLHVGASGYVTGSYFGVQMHENGGIVVNEGSIFAHIAGIVGTTGVIENLGTIEGETGIGFDSGSYVIENSGDIIGYDEAIYGDWTGTIINSEEGRIRGGQWGLYLSGESVVTEITNAGIVEGREYAIHSEGTVKLKNTGAIIGDVELGVGADRIDTRGGLVRGALIGGEGDDLYLISSARIKIIDNGASFGDAVRSTASYTLTGGLDHLTLLGSRNIAASGNAGANELYGNKGHNRLDGGAGEDYLSGGAGNDRLTGGADADTFHFTRGYDVDRIADFTDGVDLLDLEGVSTQKQFDRLDIRQAGNNVVIDLGRGDQLIIDGVSRGDLDFGDISVS